MNDSFAPAIREAIQQRDERHLRDILARIPEQDRAHQVNETVRGMPPLLAAAMSGRVGLTTALLEAGALVDAQQDPNGITALMWVATYGQADVVATLLEHGADATIVDRQGRTAEARATGEALQVLVAHRERPLLRQAAGLPTTPDTDEAPKARRRM